MLRGLVAGFGSSPQSRDFVCVCVCSFELIRVLFTSGGVRLMDRFQNSPLFFLQRYLFITLVTL